MLDYFLLIYSPYIPRNIILRYSQEGDLVLDQFAGGGTTLVEAKLLNRNVIGVDCNDEALKRCRQKMDFDYPPAQGKVFLYKGDARDLTNHEFWISKFYAMNDCTDCKYGFNLLLSVLDNKKTDITESTYNLIRNHFSDSERNWYVLSFSKEPNSRFMWEVYAQKQGYCIEIDEIIIEDTLKCTFLPQGYFATELVRKDNNINSERQFVAHSVIYSQEVQIEMISEAIAVINKQVINHDIDSIFPSLFALYEVIPFFKDPLFSDEKEYRLLAIVPEKKVNDLQYYRESNNKIIPFVKFKFHRPATIRKVTMGYCDNDKTMFRGVEEYLNYLQPPVNHEILEYPLR